VPGARRVLQGVRVGGASGKDVRAKGDWRKSTYSGGNGGSCVEVASNESVMVRDTVDREGGTLAFSAEAWQQFTRRLRG
jgi:hypothetical protein